MIWAIADIIILWVVVRLRVECSSVRNVRRMWLLDPKGAGGGGLGEDDKKTFGLLF